MPNQDSREEEGAQFVLPQFAGQALAHNLKFHEEVLQMRREGREVFHFAFGESPFPVPLAVQTALKEFVGNNEYPPVAGLESLRRGISWLHEKQEGLYLDPKDIVVGPGLKQLIFLIVHCFSGDIVLISPAWPCMRGVHVDRNFRGQ
ncbi:unnamed protein product [Cyprideis torosa]|uniref:Aminotransferase class I/classII large domain-containing protein n=1 Tax=Cyprideis torosa TaxID=163714 RepID=A0A7R8WE27_9CRUS|nr:unnamed protein product [Cyprideis torosa]CAG0889768.1 unnamed protein product [Cyprideis torosa]